MLTALLALLAPSSALASDSAAEAVTAIDAAVAAESSAPEAELVQDGGAVAPEVGSDPVSLGDGLQLGIPASGDAQTINGTTVFDAETTNGGQVAVQQASGGIRALVKIDSENAPERYDFPVSGNVSRLEHENDGSVTARDATGVQVGSFAPAWARDGLGRSVPTHYEIAGTTLTQVVDHKAEAMTMPWSRTRGGFRSRSPSSGARRTAIAGS